MPRRRRGNREAGADERQLQRVRRRSRDAGHRAGVDVVAARIGLAVAVVGTGGAAAGDPKAQRRQVRARADVDRERRAFAAIGDPLEHGHFLVIGAVAGRAADEGEATHGRDADDGGVDGDHQAIAGGDTRRLVDRRRRRDVREVLRGRRRYGDGHVSPRSHRRALPQAAAGRSRWRPGEGWRASSAQALPSVSTNEVTETMAFATIEVVLRFRSEPDVPTSPSITAVVPSDFHRRKCVAVPVASAVVS